MLKPHVVAHKPEIEKKRQEGEKEEQKTTFIGRNPQDSNLHDSAQRRGKKEEKEQ